MNDRYKPIAILAGVLFLVDAVARALVRLVWPHNDSKQTVVGFIVLGLVATVMLVVACRWTIRYPSSRALGELGLILLAACLASVVLGPLAGASYPFRSGAGEFFHEIWIYLAIGGGGAVLGILTAMAAGKDYRAQALKRFAESQAAKPRRPVRR